VGTYSDIRSDAWLLLSVVYASRFPPVTLPKILAAGDFIRHARLSRDELDMGLRRLIEGGMVRRSGEHFYPSELVLITYYLNRENRPSTRQELLFFNGLLKNEYWLQVVSHVAHQHLPEGEVVGEEAFQKACAEFQKQRRGNYEPRKGERNLPGGARFPAGSGNSPRGAGAMTNAEILTAFVDAINSQDVDEMVQWLTRDHLFADSLGQTIRGPDGVKPAWTRYFAMVPDYEILVGEMYEKPDRMVVLGTARGTYAPEGKLLSRNRWQTPAAWKVVFNEGRIQEWHVFADNEPIRQILREREANA
jgi:ketosteroid isomerase-like protein